MRDSEDLHSDLPRSLYPAWSRIGFRIATALGFAWGFALSRGAVRKEAGLWIFTGMPGWAFGRAGTCIGACYLTGTHPSAAALRHELVHVEQWKRYGLIFPLLYFLAGRNPFTNRFEVEAGLAEGGYISRPR